MSEAYDAVILAGGSGRRLGGVDKALVEVGGSVLLERVLAAVGGADRVVCVGPERQTSVAVTWCREDPPGGGPVAALAAALPHVRAEIVVVLAVDLPFVDGETVARLVAAVGWDGATGDGAGMDSAVTEVAVTDGAVGVDAGGRRQTLLAAYRRTSLLARLGSIGVADGARMRDLGGGLALLEVEVGAAATDCDTPEDVAAARAASRGARS